MKVTLVSVSAKKMFSDGNYGHQSAEVSYTAEIEAGNNPDDVILQLLAKANVHIGVQLGESETLNIRRAIHPRPRSCSYGCGEPLDIWDSGYHRDCDTRARAERDAEYRRRDAERMAAERPTGQNGEDIEAEQDLGQSDDDLVASGVVDDSPF